MEAYTAAIMPSFPTLTATPGDAQVILNWTSVPDAASYNVYRSTTPGGPYTQVAADVTGTTYTDTGLTNGTAYYYVVTAVDSSGAESGYSNEASATPAGVSNALLRITMTTGEQKEYSLSADQISDFIAWYNGNAADSPSYVFNKTYNLGSLASRRDYIAFSKIAFFEVMAYQNEPAPATPSAGTKTALLKVTMSTGDIMEYEMTSDQLASFSDWYDSDVTSTPTYSISKDYNLGPFISRTDYLVHDKIVDFEVFEY
ncbi:hypothetical protein SAMN02745823_01126 [Sporobacter termitidis DSM 10068]|uniref:Fibronectin type-III domain-containing protein n=2 Tax=Sporobacter TaxID=44748 RepID=A0A1M5W8R8_9FIRM|nr:hypothetical protein SAMN02745823_01126 [Sporobacter termitidis DSM 10068]